MALEQVQLIDPKTGEPLLINVVRGGVQGQSERPLDRQRPPWLKARLPQGPEFERLKGLVKEKKLYTVCQEAVCPNLGECWGHGTLTVMLLGGICTRGCKFCAVSTGNPKGWLDPDEPRHLAETIATLGLNYVVLTSVDRDDLSDGGADHFAQAVREIKARDPRVKVEALTPDFAGNLDSVATVLASGLDVYAHNLETTRRLTPRVRDPRATYDQSLKVLRYAHEFGGEILTKSSLMLGLGETPEEVQEAMNDLLAAGVEILTLGQYLRPSPAHLPVERYIPPEEFDQYRDLGLSLGFREVFAGPLVRSSYRAERVFQDAR